MERHLPILNAALLGSLLLAGCASTAPPEATRWNPPPVGASWEVAQKNTGSYGRDTQFRVTRGDGTWEGKPVVTLRNSSGTTTIADPATGRWHALAAPDGKPMAIFEPPIGWQYPVRVGAEHTTRHRITNVATGRSSEFDFTCKVEDYEKVTVRAGTFDAYRIACRSSLGAEETYWTNPGTGVFIKTRLVRGASHPQGPGSQEAELVSAPRRG